MHTLISTTILEATSQIFFKDDQHVFVMILVALPVAIPADRQMFQANEKDTIKSYKTYSKITIKY